ncbi:MAG: LysR family transcriptional regulator [Pseudomonadota bacterium]
MIELKPIRVLRAVSDLRSFTQAAHELELAPASVTRIIAQLESDLGAQLLVRTTRQVGLTSAGATVLARYRPLLEGFDAVTADLTRAVKPDSGHLRITAPVSLGVALLPQVVAGFRRAYPRISLEINFTDRLLDVLEETCDLAIRVSGPPKDKSTIWRKLCEVPRLAVASPLLFDSVARPDEPSALDADVLMSYDPNGGSEIWEFVQSGRQQTVRAGRRMTSNNGDFLYALAAAGEGVCVLPDFITGPGLREGKIIDVFPEWSLASLWLTLFYPPYDRLPPIVGTFAEYFETFITAHENLTSARI